MIQHHDLSAKSKHLDNLSFHKLWKLAKTLPRVMGPRCSLCYLEEWSLPQSKCIPILRDPALCCQHYRCKPQHLEELAHSMYSCSMNIWRRPPTPSIARQNQNSTSVNHLLPINCSTTHSIPFCSIYSMKRPPNMSMLSWVSSCQYPQR